MSSCVHVHHLGFTFLSLCCFPLPYSYHYYYYISIIKLFLFQLTFTFPILPLHLTGWERVSSSQLGLNLNTDVGELGSELVIHQRIIYLHLTEDIVGTRILRSTECSR